MCADFDPRNYDFSPNYPPVRVEYSQEKLRADLGVLLAPDVIEVWRSSRVPDSHGWDQTTSQAHPAELVGTFAGNLQESTPTAGPSSVADPYAADGGGRGPASPSVRRLGKAFLPVAASIVAGDTLRAYRPNPAAAPGAPGAEHLSSVWRVTSVSFSQGALGGMECYVAAVIECPAWDAPPFPPVAEFAPTSQTCRAQAQNSVEPSGVT